MKSKPLLRAVLALCLAASASAAHPQDTAPTAGFDQAFAAFRQADTATLPEPGPAPAPGPEIAHSQPSANDSPPVRMLAGGMASYYARAFDGRRTASGERFASSGLTAAHRTLPFGTQVRVTNTATGASVVVRINDRGPFKRDRVLDVSEAAARQLGLIARGSGRVELAVIDPA